MSQASKVQIRIVYFSQFKGITERLAEAVAEGCHRVPDVEARLIRCEDAPNHWADLHAADAIVFGSPTYIGGPAAGFKAFIEQLAGEVWLKRMWLNKVSAGFTVSAGRSGDKMACLQQLSTFAAQLGMIWVPMRITGGNYSSAGSEADLNRMAGYLGLMAQANIDEPLELAPPPSDLETARIHGEHIANVTRQFAMGRRALPAAYDTLAEDKPDRQPASLAQLLEAPPA